MTTAPVLLADRFVHSYLFLRRAIGVIGMALPFALVLGVLITSGEVLSSISGYYYSDLRNVFVGCMCAVGVFLIFYRGAAFIDDVASFVAGVAAVGVALFPTRPAGTPTDGQKIVGSVHIGCAAVFFLMLAFIAIKVFTRRSDSPDPQRKDLRNRIYVACGIVILGCIALMVITCWLLESAFTALHPALVLESVAILAFGVSWMVKGQTLWRDRA